MPDENQIETFVWKGQTRYRCPGRWESGAKCEFDSASRDALVMHMRAPHLREAPRNVPAAEPARTPITVADTEARSAAFKDAKFAEPKEG